MENLKKELWGAWSLISYIELPVGGSNSKFPMGKNPKGLLSFLEPSMLALQITTPEREHWSVMDMQQVPEVELAASARTFLAVSGNFRIHPKLPVLTLEPEISSIPNLIESALEYHFELESDVLYLKSVEPFLSGGTRANMHLTWKRIPVSSINHRKQRFVELITGGKEELNRQLDIEI
ncbi:MAG TPA: lipocalin-like domain-containing protein [Candidatus Sphingobacterium stercoripullorum]|nr:lipocalin-like domain-containing protein [Candidatus Sphingobacterium stercoripullorum]